MSRCALQAPLAGEIIAYLAEEGDPVEYRQELVEIAPYFGALAFALSLVTLARQNEDGHLFQLQKWCSVACGLGITVERGVDILHLFGKACCLDDR